MHAYNNLSSMKFKIVDKTFTDKVTAQGWMKSCLKVVSLLAVITIGHLLYENDIETYRRVNCRGLHRPDHHYTRHGNHRRRIGHDSDENRLREIHTTEGSGHHRDTGRRPASRRPEHYHP